MCGRLAPEIMPLRVSEGNGDDVASHGAAVIAVRVVRDPAKRRVEEQVPAVLSDVLPVELEVCRVDFYDSVVQIKEEVSELILNFPGGNQIREEIPGNDPVGNEAGLFKAPHGGVGAVYALRAVRYALKV